LHDDIKQRWNINEILVWFEGRRLSPKQGIKVNTAPRPIEFNGKKYAQIAPLAFDMRKSPEETVKLCEENKIDQWLQRSLEDKIIADHFRKTVGPLIKSAKDKDYADRVLTSALIVLDSAAPIRYKNRNIMPDGLGIALAEAMSKQEDVSIFVQLLSYGIVTNWLAVQFETELDIAALVSVFDTCQKFLKKTKIGNGMERVVYVLCPQAHCLSLTLKDKIVYESPELLTALEQISEERKLPTRVLDRHMVAFLAEKDHKIMDHFLYDLDSSEDYVVAAATLSCLALIQQRYKMPKMKNLCNALIPLSNTIINRYHDMELRKKIKEKLEKLADKGSLIEMTRLLNDGNALIVDNKEFRLALNEYDNLTREDSEIQERLIDRKEFNKNFGGEIAAAMSSIIAVFIIIIIVINAIGDVGGPSGTDFFK